MGGSLNSLVWPSAKEGRGDRTRVDARIERERTLVSREEKLLSSLSLATT